MTKKKIYKVTDPTLTPEWFEALISSPSMRGTSSEMNAEEAFMEYHRKRRTEDAEYEIAAAKQSTAPPQSPCAAECADFYSRIEIWLDNGLVTKHEIGEFAESLFRLIRGG